MKTRNWEIFSLNIITRVEGIQITTWTLKAAYQSCKATVTSKRKKATRHSQRAEIMINCKEN